MRSAEWIILALQAPGEAGEASTLTDAANAIAAAGDDLMRIGLVAHIPDQAVARCVEQIVQGHRQLDDAKTRPKMSAGNRDRIDRFLAQLGRKLRQAQLRQLAQVSGCLDPIEQRAL